MSKEIPVLNASKVTDAEFYVMECTLTVERIDTLGERRTELNGYLSKEVLDSALDMMKKVVDE